MFFTEPLVARHVDDLDGEAVRLLEEREAEVDGDAARLLLGQAVGVGPVSALTSEVLP